EIALKSYREDDASIKLLRDNGWLFCSPGRISDLRSYQKYIARSRAEIGITKNAYVKGTSGWFSDRTAHYLASGKPAAVQSTGFERRIPTGRGLLSFDSLDDAAGAIESINGDYE